MLAAYLCGCGASSIRLAAGPSFDSENNAGFESTVSLGFGMPLDYHGQSHHFLQGFGQVGGRIDGTSDSGSPTAGLGIDYIYWAHPRFDLRTGMQFVYRNIDQLAGESNYVGLGGHLALMPVGVSSDSSWMLLQLCFGPDIRIDHTWATSSERSRTHFAVPLVIEVNLLATGD